MSHNSTGRYTSTFDRLNRVKESVDPGVALLGISASTLTYEYDVVGRRRQLSNPDGGIYSYLYDAASRLIGVMNPVSERTTLGYDAAGQNTFKALANGTTAVMDYDAAGNQSRVLNLDDSSTTISFYSYGFDGVGNRTSVDEPGEQYSNWVYDGTGQLTSNLYFSAGVGLASHCRNGRGMAFNSRSSPPGLPRWFMGLCYSTFQSTSHSITKICAINITFVADRDCSKGR